MEISIGLLVFWAICVFVIGFCIGSIIEINKRGELIQSWYDQSMKTIEEMSELYQQEIDKLEEELKQLRGEE